MSSLRSLSRTLCAAGFTAALLGSMLAAPALAQRPYTTVQPGAVGSDPSWKPGEPPPKSWIDPSTGHRVVRLTDEPGSASFYFNVNAYTPDGREMAYTTRDGISVINLQTFKTRSVVQGKVRTIQVGFKTPSVYYIKDGALYVTNMDTGATRRLAAVPERGSINTINADETLAAGTYIEGKAGEDFPQLVRHGGQAQPLIQARNKGEMMQRRLAEHLPLVMFVIDLRTGKMRSILHSTAWLNHMQFSPTDPDLLMYCHEGPWQKVNRIWTIHVDGTHNTLIQNRTMFMEIAGHEFWAPDGKTIWYDWQTPKSVDFWLAGYTLATGRHVAYHMQADEWGIHFNVTRDGSLFADDGGDPGQVAHSKTGEWIELLHPQLLQGDGIDKPDFVQPGVFHAEHLVNMSRHNYHLEPNVKFSPDEKWIIFRSNMFGPTYVFAVQIAKADAAGDKAS